MAALDNGIESEIDKTSFWFGGLCAICHVGGGMTEYDQDGNMYYDVATGTWGNPAGGTAAVVLDGDYGEVNHTNGDARAAPWDVTGVLEPDCLYCHREQRMIVDYPAAPKNMNWIFRAAVLRKKDKLVDTAAQPNSVPAFAAAPTAAQGWGTVALGSPPPGKPPIANTFDIDYQKGIDDGSLYEDGDGNLRIAQTAITGSTKDWACWGCHVIADDKKRGRTWFDPSQDVHYAAFNGVTPGSPAGDLEAAAMSSQACAQCHPVTGTLEKPLEHNFGKGNANLGTVRDDTDYYGFKSCRDCHNGTDAPAPQSGIHTVDHLDSMACQFCHIPYKIDNASLAIDNAATGSTINYNTDAFLTTDQVDPTLGTTDYWWPSAGVRADSDGVDRLFPDKLLLSCWFGSWDDNGAAGPDAGDVIAPTILWRLRAAIGAMDAADKAVDDTGDGKPEVNTIDEIRTYLLHLRNTNDKYGTPIAMNPVYVKGGYVYYLDGADDVQDFEIHNSGIKVESEHPFSIDHNVLPLDLNVTLGANGCSECHGANAPVFNRAILVDPFDENGDPVYSSLSKVSGVDPND